MMPLCEICRRRWPRTASSQCGMVLVGMIVVLFLISSLVVAMMSQSTSTAFSLAYENSANRAFYVAESGYRYAVARIRHGADMKSDLHLHATAFSMAKNAGSFELSLFPHYLKTTSTISGTTLSGVDVPGGYDNGTSDALAFSGGAVKKVRILAPDGTWDDIHTYTTASLTATQDGTTGKYTATVTLTGLSPSISQSLPSGTVILPVAQVDGDQTTVGNDDGGGGTVALSVITDSTAAFPRFNGTFRIEGDADGVLYAYQEKVGDTLAGITVPLDPTATPPYSFGDGAEIVLERFVRIECNGTYQNASRALTFYMPLATPEVTVKFDEDFQNLNDWNSNGSTGGFVRENLGGGDKRLRVDSVSTTATAADKAAQIQLKSGTVEFEKAWKYGNKGFLSYDAQVKVGFDTASPAPADGTASFGDPASTLPNYYMAGINFRNRDIEDRTETKSYGLSFMRGPGTSFPINAKLVPSDGPNRHLLVLWQQTGEQSDDLQWLAYMDMNPTFFSDDMEDSWSRDSLYRNESDIGWQTTDWAISTASPHGGAKSWRAQMWGFFFWYFFDDTLTADAMNLSMVKNATLGFWHRYKFSGSGYALLQVTNSAGGWTTVRNYPFGTAGWNYEQVDISSFLPNSSFKVRFFLVNSFGASNDYWYIDDVKISKEVSVQESTLSVRVKEAPVVVFSNGSDAGGDGFQEGDLVYEDGGRIHGIVDGTPLVTGGTWTAGTATGLIPLRSVAYDNTKSGTSLKAIGSSTTATLVVYGERENLIRAFIADPTGEGSTGDLGSALDYLKSGYPRRTTSTSDLQWPPGDVANWPASLDYFSLVRWDDVNSSSSDYQAWSAVAGGTAIAADSFSLISAAGEPNAVIRTNTLISPSDTTTSYSHSELGLHAFGDGAENTYFDDFGVKLDIGAQYRYAPVVQE